MGSRSQFKYEQIYGELKRLITDGHYREGARLPSETELAESYNVSRPTVTRALRALSEEQLIHRRAGSGSYVLDENTESEHRLFGLLIPGLGKREIFEPITGQIATLAEANDFALLWSGSEPWGEDLERSVTSVARRYVSSGVSGVFFAPVEFSPRAREINEAVLSLFSGAGIPVVLLDTDYLAFPGRSNYDLVGIDNVSGGYTVTYHLLQQGARRVDFFARPYSAHTILLRQRGYRAALLDRGITPAPQWLHWGDPEDPQWVERELLEKGVTDLVCGNDETAATLMHTLDLMDVAIPESFRLVGFDDVRYAQLLRVPLTTFHQPVSQIGNAALELMLWRLDNRDSLPRQVTLPGHLVVRRSSGASVES